MRLSEIKSEKNATLETIEPDRTVHDAIRKLCDANIGALPVCTEDGALVGIITERDVLRLCAGEDCQERLQRRIETVMTTDLVVAVPDDDVDYAMRVMTQHRVRHLPVLEGRQLVGIVSIGDVVKSKHEEDVAEMRYMRDYLCGSVA